MSTNERHAAFAISFNDNNQVKIESDGCSIVSEFFEDKNAERKTMNPADTLFSAFAL